MTQQTYTPDERASESKVAMYTAYVWDHHCDHWEFDSEADSKWELRPILRRLRRYYDDVSFLITSGIATDHGYLAAEKDEVL